MLPSAGGRGNFIYMQVSESDLPSKTGQDDAGDKVARLASVPIPAPDSDLCMSFWYHMFGEHTGALHVKLRTEAEGAQILWTVRGHQGSQWKEGRVLLPRAGVSYQVRQVAVAISSSVAPPLKTFPPQVILEGVADKRNPVHIAVDNIQLMDGLAADECTGGYWDQRRPWVQLCSNGSLCFPSRSKGSAN